MSGDFGWGDEDLGTIVTTGYHSLNGSEFITKPEFDTSASVTGVVAEGEMLRGSNTTPGVAVIGTTDYASKSSVAAGGSWKPWGSTGFSSYSKSYVNHANVIEISWNKGDYPGYWYIYQKSLIARDADNNNYYDFSSATYRFTDSADDGYNDE